MLFLTRLQTVYISKSSSPTLGYPLKKAFSHNTSPLSIRLIKNIRYPQIRHIAYKTHVRATFGTPLFIVAHFFSDHRENERANRPRKEKRRENPMAAFPRVVFSPFSHPLCFSFPFSRRGERKSGAKAISALENSGEFPALLSIFAAFHPTFPVPIIYFASSFPASEIKFSREKEPKRRLDVHLVIFVYRCFFFAGETVAFLREMEF